MRKIIIYLGRWVAMRAYLVIPALYVMLALLLNIWTDVGYCGTGFLFSVLLGIMCYSAAKSWYNHEFVDDEIDFVDDIAEEESELTLQQMWNDMPWWERLHWIPILGFLGLTWWAMVKGLGLLFIGGATPFVYIFSTVVALTLLWLIVMVSRKKNIVGFVIFYIVFDAMSAFSFNFVEFYDNISGTQHMERDMNDCRRLSDIQGEYIELVSARVDSLCTHYNSDVKSVKSSISEHKSQAEEAERKSNQNRENREWESARLNRNDARVHRSKIGQLNSQLENSERHATRAQSLKNQLDTLRVDRSSLDSLTALYRNDKQHFTSKDWRNAKDLSLRMGTAIYIISGNELLGKQNSQVNPEVEAILHRLKSNEQDRFASINKLFKALGNLVSDSVGQKNLVLQELSDTVGISTSGTTRQQSLANMAMTAEEHQFENRLLYLSIMLSILIDLLPLALGVFVAYSRRRRVIKKK